MATDDTDIPDPKDTAPVDSGSDDASADSSAGDSEEEEYDGWEGSKRPLSTASQVIITTIVVFIALGLGALAGSLIYDLQNNSNPFVVSSGDVKVTSSPSMSPPRPTPPSSSSDSSGSTGTAVTGKPDIAIAQPANGMMPIRYGGSGTVFVADPSLSDTAGEASVYKFSTDPAAVEDQAKQIADSLGFGTSHFVMDANKQWSVQENVGTENERMLSISGTGMGYFSYNARSPYSYGCAIPVPVPMPYSADGSGAKGSAGTSPETPSGASGGSASAEGGTVTSGGGMAVSGSSGPAVGAPAAPNYDCGATLNVTPYDPKKATDDAKAFLEKVYPSTDMQWSATAYGPLTSVEGQVLIEGEPVGVTFMFQYDPEGVMISANGVLGTPVDMGSFATEGALATVERSNLTKWSSFVIWDSPVQYAYPMMGSGGGGVAVAGSGGVQAEPPVVVCDMNGTVTSSNGDVSSCVASTDPQMSSSPSPSSSSDALVTVQVDQVNVLKAEQSWAPYYGSDGSLLVVPAWKVGDGSGQRSWKLISLSESAVEFLPTTFYSGPQPLAQ